MRYPFFTKISYLAVIASFPFLVSCAAMKATDANLKKVDATLAKEKESSKSESAAKVAPDNKDSYDQSKPIPLSEFLSPNLNQIVLYSNTWYRKLLDWAEIYKKIAIEEKNVRNFTLSQKYSKTALLWSERAMETKSLSQQDATKVVVAWLDYLPLPPLPQPSTYFVAREAFEKIVSTRTILEQHKKKLCLVEKGFQIIPAFAYLEFSVDLFQGKNYSKSLIMIQNSWSLINILETDKDPCQTQDEFDKGPVE